MLGWQLSSSSFMCLGAGHILPNGFRVIESQSVEGFGSRVLIAQ